MRAFTDITARDISMNVVARVDARFRPPNIYFSYFRQGWHRASGRIAVDGDTLIATADGVAGKITKVEKVPGTISVVTHPLALDSWTSWHVEPRRDIDQTGAI